MSSNENYVTDGSLAVFDMVNDMTDKANEEMTQQLEVEIIKFFGSEENFKKLSHRYVLETFQTPIKVEPGDGLTVRYKIEIKYRIRLKTAKELAANG